jgi:hypothetical protein
MPVVSTLLQHSVFLCEISDSVTIKITIFEHIMFIIYFYFVYIFFLYELLL